MGFIVLESCILWIKLGWIEHLLNEMAEQDWYFDLKSNMLSISIFLLKGEVGCSNKISLTQDKFSIACITVAMPGVSSWLRCWGLKKGTSAEKLLAISAISSESVDTTTLSIFLLFNAFLMDQ